MPTSFYRHFGDMDELGLAVVDQLGLDLRRLMRGADAAGVEPAQVVREGVAAYQRYVLDNAELVEFVNQARTGGTPPLRQAIGNELESFGIRVASAVREVVPGLKAAEADTVAQVVLAVLLESAGPLLDLAAKSEDLRDEAREALEARLTVILLGAQQLASAGSPPAAAAKRKPRARPAGGPR